MGNGPTIPPPAGQPPVLSYACAPRPTTLRQWARRGALLPPLVLLLYALLLGVLYRGWRAEQPSIAAIEQGGGELGTVPCGPQWPLLPEPLAWLRDRANDVSLMGTPADALLVHVVALTELRSLDLGSSQVTDAGVAHLQGLTRLAGLNLSDNPITNTSAAYLERLTALTYLYLNATDITDAGLVHLVHMADLRRLSLDDTAITDAGIAHLQGLTQLAELSLSNTRITDTGLGILEHMPGLKRLDLGGTRVSIPALERFHKIRPDVQIASSDPAADGAGDLARNKPASASSIENDEHNAAQANDGDDETYWCADDDSDGFPEYWQVDLQQPADLRGAQIRWQFPGKPYQYKVEGSADAQTWRMLSDQTRNVQTTAPHHVALENARGIRYVRITVTGVEEGCWVGIRDVKIFGR